MLVLKALRRLALPPRPPASPSRADVPPAGHPRLSLCPLPPPPDPPGAWPVTPRPQLQAPQPADASAG